jgi:hypothetical protein
MIVSHLCAHLSVFQANIVVPANDVTLGRLLRTYEEVSKKLLRMTWLLRHSCEAEEKPG